MIEWSTQCACVCVMYSQIEPVAYIISTNIPTQLHIIITQYTHTQTAHKQTEPFA